MKPRTFKKPSPSPIWYWGIHDEWSLVFAWKRSELTPHLCFRSAMPTAYCGWDVDRGRFIVRSLDDPGIKNIGWRKDAFRRR